MSDWYKKLKSLVKEKLKDFPAETYFIAVSGGRDSVFLFHLLKDILPVEKLVVLHMNHSLRGDFSDQDQYFVENLAKQNGIICHSTKVSLNLKPGSGGLENVARTARYEWFKLKIAKENGIVFCGHTLDDHIETILMKMHRGSGLAGLKGISYQQFTLGVSVCRPLLFTERCHITEFLSENNLPWRDDHTNLEPEYFRNEVRLNLTPQLSLTTKQKIVKLSALSAQLQSHFKLPEGMIVSSGVEYNLADIEKLSFFELRYLIEKIFHYFGLPAGPEKKHMDRIRTFLEEKKSKVQLSNFVNIFYARDKIYFNQENKASLPFVNAIELKPIKPACKVSKDQLILELPEKMEPLIKWRFVDFSKDNWRGKSLDYFVKKLKIPPWRKKLIPVCEYNGEILYISYLGVNENYHNLISGHTELVTIEILNKKVCL